MASTPAASPEDEFPGPGVSLPDYWGTPHVWWDGRATFTGQVIVPACSLAMEDAWQVVDIGAVSVRNFRSGIDHPVKRVQLRLRNCELTDKGKEEQSLNRVRVTFEGLRGDVDDEFAVTGQARGVALQIRDSQNDTALPGKVMSPQLATGNEQALKYSIYIVPDGKQLLAGAYYASLRFKIDYE